MKNYVAHQIAPFPMTCGDLIFLFYVFLNTTKISQSFSTTIRTCLESLCYLSQNWVTKWINIIWAKHAERS